MRWILGLVSMCVACEVGSRGSADGALLNPVTTSIGDTTVIAYEGDLPDSAYQEPSTVWTVAATADDTTTFSSVWQAAVDVMDRVWLRDEPSGRFFVFSGAGQRVGIYGRRGGGPGEFEQVNGLVPLRDSGMAVWDADNARVTFLTRDGRPRHAFPTPGGYYTNNGLQSDSSGRFLLRRPLFERGGSGMPTRQVLVRIDTTGTQGDTLIPPVNEGDMEQYRAGTDRVKIAIPVPFGPRVFWAWHPGGFYVWARGGRSEFGLSRPGSPNLMVRRVTTPVTIAEEQREFERARVTWQLRRSVPDWTWQGPDIPSTKAWIDDLRIDRTGRIWLGVATPSQRIPDAELPEADASGQPIQRFTSADHWEVFSSSGAFLGAVALPRRASLVDATGSSLWFLERDADDLPSITRATVALRTTKD